MLTEVEKNRENLVNETLQLYFEEDGTPKDTRSLSSDKRLCLYKSKTGDGTIRHCAIGRLAPDANWVETKNCYTFTNMLTTLKVMKEINCHSGNDDETLRFAMALQQYGHDISFYTLKERRINLEKFYKDESK